MQWHIGSPHPSIGKFEKSVFVISALGVEVIISELGLAVLPSPGQNDGADVSANFEYQRKMKPYATG